MKKTIFTLTEARTATLYLRNLFALNARDCACRHETFFDWGNPAMFGPAIYDAFAGRNGRIRRRLERKRRYIEKLPEAAYLESSHAFLKSSYLAALDVFPNLRLIHLVRDPLKVAASAAWRELWRRRLRVPFHFYAGDDGKRHFVWALTGNEDIFRLFDGAPLTLFQWYLLQWIEIENRAMAFLNDFQLHGRCFTLRVPEDLDNADILRRMFGFFGLPVRRPQILLARRKNRSFGYISAPPIGLERQRGHILERLPSPYLQIFRREPYASLPWSRPLRESAAPPIPAAKAGD